METLSVIERLRIISSTAAFKIVIQGREGGREGVNKRGSKGVSEGGGT